MAWGRESRGMRGDTSDITAFASNRLFALTLRQYDFGFGETREAEEEVEGGVE